MKKTIFLALAGSAVLVTGAVALVPPSPKATSGTATVASGKATTSAVATPAAAPTTRVYYFHGNFRCNTCKTIEAYARETLTRAFAKDLETKRLDWQVVNVDQPANKHFVQDFQLYTRSLVVVDAKDAKRFKVLERVWELVGDKPAFQKYVEEEVRGFGRS